MLEKNSVYMYFCHYKNLKTYKNHCIKSYTHTNMYCVLCIMYCIYTQIEKNLEKIKCLKITQN